MLSEKTFFQATGIILSVVGLIHLLRFFTGWPIVIDGWTFPLWLSIFGVIIPWYLAYNAFTLAGKKSRKT